MPAEILNYIEHDRNILRVEDEILNIIITLYLADMSKYTENIEAIRNVKIYNSMPAQLGKENKNIIGHFGNIYELDFLMNIEEDIIPVEVKASIILHQKV